MLGSSGVAKGWRMDVGNVQTFDTTTVATTQKIIRFTFTLTCFLSVDYHLESCVAITLYGHYLFLSSSLICILSIYVA